MGTYNNITILGRLGRDPETRFTNSGKQVCDFSVATDRKSGGESIADWHKVVCWDKTAEIAGKFLKKGAEVMVTGDVRYSKYTGKDGVERHKTEVNCRQITLIGKRDSSVEGTTNEASSGPKGKEIPF